MKTKKSRRLEKIKRSWGYAHKKPIEQPSLRISALVARGEVASQSINAATYPKDEDETYNIMDCFNSVDRTFDTYTEHTEEQIKQDEE